MTYAPEDNAAGEGLRGEAAESANLRGIAGAVALFAVGFVLMALALHSTLRDPLGLYATWRSEKLEMLSRLHGSVYSAAFGSSHIHNGFAPAVFDRELDGGGAPHLRTQTMNLAVAGGSQAEQRVMALQFVKQLATPPRGETCMVILELNAGANFQMEFMVHPRTVDIYDWQTARFISTLTSPRMSASQRAGRTGYALVAAGLHYINLGMLANRIFEPPLDDSYVQSQMVNDQRGQEVMVPEPPGRNELEHKIATEPKSSKPEVQMITPGNVGLAEEIEAASPVKNLAFVYIVYPKLEDLSGPLAYPDHLTANGRDIPIVNLAQPAVYPELYDVKNWHDDAHLDGKGAALATGLVVSALKQWYAEHGAPPTCGGR